MGPLGRKGSISNIGYVDIVYSLIVLFSYCSCELVSKYTVPSKVLPPDFYVPFDK